MNPNEIIEATKKLADTLRQVAQCCETLGLGWATMLQRYEPMSSAWGSVERAESLVRQLQREEQKTHARKDALLPQKDAPRTMHSPRAIILPEKSSASDEPLTQTGHGFAEPSDETAQHPIAKSCGVGSVTGPRLTRDYPTVCSVCHVNPISRHNTTGMCPDCFGVKPISPSIPSDAPIVSDEVVVGPTDEEIWNNVGK